MCQLMDKLRHEGRFTIARRLREAQEASESAAQDTLLLIGRAIARRDKAGAIELMQIAAAHYRNAGNGHLAAHWSRRAAFLRLP